MKITYVEPRVELNVAVVAQARVDAGALHTSYATAFMPLSTTVLLPTTCLSFDKDAKTLGPVRSSTAATTATAGSSGTLSASARPAASVAKTSGGLVLEPFGVMRELLSQLVWTVGILVLIGAAFSAL